MQFAIITSQDGKAPAETVEAAIEQLGQNGISVPPSGSNQFEQFRAYGIELIERYEAQQQPQGQQ